MSKSRFQEEVYPLGIAGTGRILQIDAAIAVEPETVAWGKDRFEQHKRLKQVEEGLSQILNSVKSNWYYNDLSRVLMGSNLMADVLNGHLMGKPTPNVDDRINSLLVHHQVQQDKRAEIKGAIDRMCACIDAVMQKPSDSQETRFAY